MARRRGTILLFLLAREASPFRLSLRQRHDGAASAKAAPSLLLLVAGRYAHK